MLVRRDSRTSKLDGHLMDYQRLSSLSEDELSHIDIAELNLACAVGLPRSSDFDIPTCLNVLDQWTSLVRAGTKRAIANRHRFPDYDDLSDSEYRVLTMFSVLYRHVGLTINTDVLDPNNVYDGSDSRIQFIHAVLSDGFPATCCTAPVVFAAIGRRLGYPIRLVQTREHIFCRWSGETGERFNIEATDRGYYRTPDEHYLTWPRPVFHKAIQEGLFLTDLTSKQELGLFLHLRGICLLWNLHVEEAVEAFHGACELYPTNYFSRNEYLIAQMLFAAKHGDKSQYSLPDRDPVFWRIPEHCRNWNQQLHNRAQQFLNERRRVYSTFSQHSVSNL